MNGTMKESASLFCSLFGYLLRRSEAKNKECLAQTTLSIRHVEIRGLIMYLVPKLSWHVFCPEKQSATRGQPLLSTKAALMPKGSR